MTFADSVDPGRSEFEEAYEDQLAKFPPAAEAFPADLLEEPVERALKPKKPVCVAPSHRLSDVISGMADRNHGCVLVVDDDRLVGIFTERDVVRRVVGRIDTKETPVSEVMTRDPEAIAFFDSIAFALNKMTVGGFRHVPVVDMERRPIGVISVKDLIRYFAEHFPAKVLNVPPDPTIRNPDQIAGA